MPTKKDLAVASHPPQLARSALLALPLLRRPPPIQRVHALLPEVQLLPLAQVRRRVVERLEGVRGGDDKVFGPVVGAEIFGLRVVGGGRKGGKASVGLLG